MNKRNWFNHEYIKKINKSRRRQQLTNVTYHTMSRCINKESLLKRPAVLTMVMEVVEMAFEKYDFILYDFVFMDNHFHLKIKIINENHSISLIMQFIKAQIARRYNKMYNRSGPFWNERFGDSIIEHAENPEEYANYLAWYFAYNPVKKGFTKKPGQYYLCGINFYLYENYKPPLPLEHDPYFLNLGTSFSERVAKFRKYEAKAIEMMQRGW